MGVSITRKLTIKFIFNLLTILAANGAILLQQHQPAEYSMCSVSEIKGKFYFTQTIRPLVLNCGDEDIGMLPVNAKCTYSYQCPLDDAFRHRKGVTTCLRDGSWEYYEPQCEDNMELLDQINKAFEEERRSFPAQIRFGPAVLKSIFIGGKPAKEEKKNEEVVEEEETDEPMEETTASMNVTTPTTPMTRKVERTTNEAQFQRLKLKIMLTNKCNERKMCMWSQLPGRCRIFEPLPVLRKLCDMCVQYKVCKGRGISLLGGTSG